MLVDNIKKILNCMQILPKFENLAIKNFNSDENILSRILM